MLHIRYTCFSLLGLVFFIQPLRAQLYELPFSEIVSRSTLIVEGRVIARNAFWDNLRHNIYTANTVAVSGIFKGAATAPATLQVITRGGIVGDRMDVVSESVQYAVGDAGLFCLVPASMDIPVTPAWENYGSPHGFFRYDLYANTVEHPFHTFSQINDLRENIKTLTREPVITIPGQELNPVTGDRATPVITSFSPTTTAAGIGSILTINGSNFGPTQGVVRFVNANNGLFFDADVSDILSWSDTQITTLVPSTSSTFGVAGTGTIQVRNTSSETGTSSGILTIDYAYTNFIDLGIKYGGKLVERNGDGGMTYTMSTSICNTADQDAVNAIGRALREWRCATGVNWELSTATTASTAIVGDGINIITWDVSVPLTGAVGQATSRFNGCINGGNVYWYVDEVDINLGASSNWYFCDNAAGIPFASFDFQSVVFHELGHGHQLGHVNNTAAVMHRSISNSQIKRTLTAGELGGADFIINQSPNPCGPDPMTLLSSPACLGMVMPTACDDAGSCTASLPVELLYFRGAAVETGIRLDWSTATEFQNDFFTLERSADAIAFTPLANIPGESFSTAVKTYGYLDAQPLAGLNYYRLRQTDRDGSTTALGTIAIRFGKSEPLVRVYPNPIAGDQIYIATENLEAGERMELVLTDLTGRQVARQELEIAGPVSTSALLLSGVDTGVYLLWIYAAEDRRLLRQELLVKR